MGKRAREPSAAELPASSPAADAPLWWHVSEDEWYQQTIDHWSQQSGLNGVLGGCSEIDSLDAEGSLAFLSESVQQSPQQPSPQQPSPQQQSPQQQLFASSHALECGAGVGRVTSSVLLHVTQSVHLVEVSPPLIEQARSNLSLFSGRVTFECTSLQDFQPPTDGTTFTLVWLQWVLGHLTDTGVVRLLKQCKRSLRAGGSIVLKENIASRRECKVGRGRYMLDKANAAVIRSHEHMLTLCRLAGLAVVRSKPQKGLPKDYYAVRMYELVPDMPAC